MAKRKKVKLPRILNNQEIELVRNQFPIHTRTGRRDQVLFDTLLATGMRISEALSMRYDLIITADNGNTFYNLKDSKNGEEAFIYLPNNILEMIYDVKKLFEHKDNDYVFTAVRDGQKALLASYYRRKIKEVGKEAGIRDSEEFHTHNLRATFACKILDDSSDIYLVSQMLRHKALSSTMHYLRIMPSKGISVVNRLFN